jgi:hypothetical protein
MKIFYSERFRNDILSVSAFTETEFGGIVLDKLSLVIEKKLLSIKEFPFSNPIFLKKNKIHIASLSKYPLYTFLQNQ